MDRACRLALVGFAFVAGSVRAQLAVTSTQPGLNALNVARNAPVVVNFDRPVNPATFTATSFRVFGKLSGPIAGTLAFSNANQTATFTQSSRPLLAGEVALVM